MKKLKRRIAIKIHRSNPEYFERKSERFNKWWGIAYILNGEIVWDHYL